MVRKPDHLSYKFQRLREAVRAAILNGELQGKLPGERELARRFLANAKTISKALSDLTSEGLLIRQVGRGTFVADGTKADPALRKERTFLWIEEAGSNHEFRETMHRKVTQILKQQGHRLRVEAVEADTGGELPRRGVTSGSLRDVTGVVVCAATPSSDLVAELLRRHLPLVLCNATCPNVRTHAVHADYARGAYELTEHLIELGHANVALLLPAQKSTAFDDAVRGHATALRRYGLPICPPVRLGELGHNAQDRGARPTALVVAGTDLAACVIADGKDRGLCLPDDLSVSILPEPGDMLGERLGLTAYEVDPDDVVAWVIRLLVEHAPGQRPREAFVPGRLVDRGSTKPPANVPAVRRRPKEACI